MFKDPLLASSILALVCVVIIVVAAVIWVKYGKKKKNTVNTKVRAAAAIDTDKTEKTPTADEILAGADRAAEALMHDTGDADKTAETWGETLAEYEDGKDDAETDTADTDAEETADDETETETVEEE